MEYRSLGRTGVKVSIACLGTMTFGWEPDDWGCDESESEKILKSALDLGINFIDTANVYGRGASERILGKFLTQEKRKHIVLATKGYGVMSDEDPNMWGNSRRNIIEACEASLKRLNTDWIDLYQIHRPHPDIPIDETIRALDDLVRSGKVRYVGCSTFAAWQVCEAHYVAKVLGTSGFISEQPPYNLLDRRIERELLPFCRTYDYAVLPWSPLAGGMLAGKYLEGIPEDARYSKHDPLNRVGELNRETVAKLKDLADQHGMSLATLSLAWVASQPGITSPIIGAKRADQLEETVSACQTKLSEEILKQIDEIVKPGSYEVNYYRAEFGPNKRPNC